MDSGSTTFNYPAILVLEAAFLPSNPLILQMNKQGSEIFLYLNSSSAAVASQVMFYQVKQIKTDKT